MKKLHIFWILTDGIRNKPGRDKYGRLKAYYDIDKESIRFTKAITSGCSTLMSMSSQYTGRFSSELYPDFNYISKKGFDYPTYFDVFKKEGYVLNSMISEDGAGRQVFAHALNVFKTDPLSFYNAKDAYAEFVDMMETKFKKDKPNFTFIHYGSFEDLDEYVQKTVQYIKDEGLYDDSIVIMSSDHGYVDYGNLHYLGWALQPRTHSYYIDDNTVLANLNIKLPSSLSKVKAKEVNTPVCLIDVLETVADYIGVKYLTENKKAMSLKPLIEKGDQKTVKSFENRIIKIDSRYVLQNYRKSRLIDGHGSFIVKEDGNLNGAPDRFKEEWARTEQEAKKTTHRLLEKEWNTSDFSKLKNQKVAIYNYNYEDLISFVYDKLKKNNDVSILDLNSIKKNYREYDVIIGIVNNPMFHKFDELHRFCREKRTNLLLINSFFKEMPYQKYSYLRGALNDPAIKKSKYPFIVNCGLYVMILLVKWYETVLLNTPRNYHKIVK